MSIPDNSVETASPPIDFSLLAYFLRKTYEERIVSHEHARQLVIVLEQAGDEFHAKQS